MNLNLTVCFFVLENEKSANIKKNDIKKLKLLVRKKDLSLPSIIFNAKTNIKEELREYLEDLVKTKTFHLEQVFTLGEEKFFGDKLIDVIHLGLANIESINDLDTNYELIDIGFNEKKTCIFKEKIINYKTKTVKKNKNIEYYHEIETDDIALEKKITEIIIAYKHLKSKIDFSDLLFKLLPAYFTLEDTRIVYELITEKTVDKSNFRKKIEKYCEKTNKIIENKGYRPTSLYKYIYNEDIWL